MEAVAHQCRVDVEWVSSSFTCLQITRVFEASDIIAVDVDDDKLHKAKVFGATHTVNANQEDAVQRIRNKPWMEQFSMILEQPVRPGNPDDWSLRTEFLKCLNQFVQNFPSVTLVIVRALWQTFASSLKVYLRSSVEGIDDSYNGRYDSDGAEKILDSLYSISST